MNLHKYLGGEMYFNRCIHAIAVLVFLVFPALLAQQAEYLPTKPMSKALSVSTAPVKDSGTIKLPVITWGGDVADVYAQEYGIFKNEGLNVELFLENNFIEQVKRCISGETPYLRGTMGMINASVEAFEQKGIELVVFYKKTWSTGGDAMVVRQGKNLDNIKTIALQYGGPHMDYAAKLFKDKKRSLNTIDFKWMRELTADYKEAGSKILDPVTAFQTDGSLNAVMCIIPDALALTSGGKVGDGSAGTVKGAKILLSTKTAGTIIGDVIAVRKDWFDTHRQQVQKLTSALLKAEEELTDLIKNKNSQQAKYRQLLSEAAALLWGTSAGSSEIEALLGDCTYDGYNGNVSFFTGAGTTRNFDNLTAEIQTSFMSMGLLAKKVKLAKADWDYQILAVGLKYAKPVSTPKKKFDSKKVATVVEEKIGAEADSWGEEGTLFEVEIYFEPNQLDFPEAKYAKAFDEALRLAQTYDGSLITIEGHSDPHGIDKAKKDDKPKPIINQMIQKAKDLSYKRANEVKNSFITYAKSRKITLDESQFYATGFGISKPKHYPILSKEQWAENRRVVFRIMVVEGEATEFER
jgi:outer membrane protein OmpA-like peptidoglycan-associated protein/ABC-type nitrate/sulfonate/bicarbonate transport system substrate-binding protein